MVDMDKIISQEIMVMKMKEKIENKILFRMDHLSNKKYGRILLGWLYLS